MIKMQKAPKGYENIAYGLNGPEELQNKGLFVVMLHFCRGGRQNLRQLKKTDFSLKTDSTGTCYECKATDEITKKKNTSKRVSMEI